MDANVKLVSSFPSERAQSVMAEGGNQRGFEYKEENPLCPKLPTDNKWLRWSGESKCKVWGMTQAPELVQLAVKTWSPI